MDFYLQIIFFIIAISLIFSFFNYSKNDKTEVYLNSLKEQYTMQYKIMYDNFNQLSQNTFYGIINKPEIYNNLKLAYKKDDKTQQYYRKKLYDTFISDYNRLLNFNFKQVHFHFPNNESFLRMHKSTKFGDDLSNIRYSVVKANKTLKPVNGFEVGKIVHGFRFVYPMHDENLIHIGSVETSVSSYFFEKSFEKNYNVDTHFLVKRNICENKMFKNDFDKLITSDENKEYLLEEKDGELIHFTHNKFYNDKELKIINQKMAKGETFILAKYEKENYVTICFMPVSNVEGLNNSAYLVIYKSSDYIKQLQYNYYKVIFILLLLIAVFIFYINSKYNKQQENKQKELILSQQSKMASMGEMLGNIAHQWRQPLSVISTAASGIQIQKEYGMLRDEDLDESIDGILRNTKYLSQTIDDFRNFFKENKEKESFDLKTLVEQSLDIFGSSFSTNSITIVQNIEDIKLKSFPNELKQVLINLFKNAKDIIGKSGIIIITATQNKNIVTINVQDSGGGVPHEVMPRIFEPYFTTKHQSVGTGLGLFMSFEIINKNLSGSLVVKNEQFEYNFKHYVGACFTITLNTQKL